MRTRTRSMPAKTNKEEECKWLMFLMTSYPSGNDEKSTKPNEAHGEAFHRSRKRCHPKRYMTERKPDSGKEDRRRRAFSFPSQWIKSSGHSFLAGSDCARLQPCGCTDQRGARYAGGAFAAIALATAALNTAFQFPANVSGNIQNFQGRYLAGYRCPGWR